MRNTLLLIFITVLQAYAKDTYSQNTKLTLTLNNVTVADVLEEIQNRSEFYFLFNAKLVDVEREVSLSMKDMTISEILTSLFSETGVNFLVYDRQIILTKSDASSLSAAIQQQKISGTVTDENGNILPGVTVHVKGTTLGILTDTKGKYTIDNAPQNATLIFSFVGMATQEIQSDGRMLIDVVLKEESIGLEEVVVIGYGTQKKINLTGAVSNVDSKVMENRPIINLGQALQGSISNLNITQSNGSLGQSASFNIRGNTSINGGSPLILVNGIPMDINLINTNDIDNVTVLKDAASAAIYGARAAYGVILITTKSGKKKDQPTVSLSMNYSINIPIVRLELMNVMERMAFMNEGSMRISGHPYAQFDEYYEAAITAHYNDPSQPEVFTHPNLAPNEWAFCANTDWPRELMRDSYPMQQYTASVSGGSDKIDYYTSLGYFNQKGTARHFDERYNRYNLMTNLNYKIAKWLTVGTKISINNSDKIYPPNDSRNIFDEKYTNFFSQSWPNWPVYLPDGHYATSGTVPNIVQMQEEGGYRTRDISDSWLTGLVKLTPVKNMTFNMDYSFNVNNTEELDYRRELPKYDKTGSIVGYFPFTYPNSVTRTSYNNRYNSFNAYADYENTFNEKHYFKAMVGFNQEDASNSQFQASRQNLMISTMPQMHLASGERFVDDAASKYAIRGAFSRLNYSFANRYFFEFNGRYDGSSKFPKKDRFEFFPSVSLGWRIDNEAFFSGLKNSINMLKFRVSYGNLGNQNVPGYYPYIGTFNPSVTDYILGVDKPMTVSAPGLVSPTLTWETVSQRDFGVDFEVLDNRLTGSFDIYRRDTKNMLTKSQTLPAILAVNEPLSNAANMKTTGFDFTLEWRHSIHDVRYGIIFLLSNYTGEITKYSNPGGIISDYYVGSKIGEIWGLVTGGLFQTDEEAAALDQSQINGRKREAGDIWFVDLNHDGKINRGNQTLAAHGDMKIIGNTTPHYSFGIKPSVSWKGFDLEIFLQGIGKCDRVLENRYFLEQYTNEWITAPKIGTDYWSPENRDAYFPRPLIGGGTDVTTPQTRFLQNAAYMRLKQLSFGYTIPVNLTQKVRVERIRVYFSGENLCEVTKMLKVSDPEQFGARFYPLNRSISLGANIDF